MEYKINQQEREALKGLPYLPRLVYYEGLRPFMDYQTGVVGIKRGISYQSLSEMLYIEPHSGYQGGSPSKDQIRRALQSLQRANVIRIQSNKKKLIICCLHASRSYFARNKPASKQPQQIASLFEQENNITTETLMQPRYKPDSANFIKPTTPQETDNCFDFLSTAFEIFWEQYPEKKSKIKAWEIFKLLNPNESLFQEIISGLTKQCSFFQTQKKSGCWVPNWKYPANWLESRCWEDVISVDNNDGESAYEITRKYNKPRSASELLWESCKTECEDSAKNIIKFEKYRK